MRNLRKFNTVAEYEAAELIYPAVSKVDGQMIYDYEAPVKWIATYEDTHTESAQCDSTSEIEYGEIEGTDLISVEISDCVTSIEGSAFMDCSSLTSVVIPNSVTTIGNGAFSNCSSLASIDIPSGVTSIDNYTFYSCYALTSVTIPNAVTTIGEYAFQYCFDLSSVNIPSGVTSIGDRAFDGCSSLTSITVNATVPPQLGYEVFSIDEYSPTTIYVPAASVEAYKAASGWSTYADRIQAIP